MQAFLEKHGLNYTVQKTPAVVKNADGTYSDVDGQFHLVRSTDGAVISPSTVSDRYVATNPQEMVAPLAPMVSEGWITPDECHLFKGGSYEVVIFAIDGGTLSDGGSIVGENWVHYLSLHNHQGGGGKLKGSITSFRPECLNMCMAAARSASFGIRHSGSLQANYEWAVQTWQKLKDEIRELSKRMEVLSSKTITPVQAKDILHRIYGVKDPEKISTRTANELDFATREFSNPTRATHGKTLFDLYNAVTATNTHYSPKGSKEGSDKRLASMFDENGTRYKLEADALNLLLEVAS